MKLDESMKDLLRWTADQLSRPKRRKLYAQVVRALGRGGQRWVQEELGWSRTTARKGEHELRTGIECKDACNRRGAKPVENHLPNLRADIKAIVDEHCQTDPTFETTRLYRRLTAKEVRLQLLARGYNDEELPSEETIRKRLNLMGYNPTKVCKSKPKKKIPETDAIFEQMSKVVELSKADGGILRISLDAKARVKVGEFSRGGRSRAHMAALDHDHAPEAILTPTGIYLPEYDELHIALVESKVTSDCIVDHLDEWWTKNKTRFPETHTLLLNQDNGPENNSRRTQFIKRIIEFADKHKICVRLAYYPPYHSKYNPIERCWGALENYWNGCLLNTVKAVKEFAGGMTWNGRHPTVKLVTKPYETGIKLAKKAMDKLEERLDRLPGLGKWFVDIAPIPVVAPG